MITYSNVSKRYPGGHSALNDVSCDIKAGELVFITGHSGAGKSTFLKLVSTIERPTSGSIVVNGQNISALRASALPHLRRHFGLIFQDQKLLFDRNALQNVMLPLAIIGTPLNEASRRAHAALDKVGLLDRARANPIALSGGEQQRLAIARAVVHRPAVLLADEPTANLDAESADIVFGIFHAFHQVGVTVLIATHHLPTNKTTPTREIRLGQGRLTS